jgi:hypothetical protein
MKEFSSRIVVMREGAATVVAPSSSLTTALREDELERYVVDHPELLGEELLVLGSQLAEFAEDRDRLDVLALDRDGELVLVELKVSDAFRVTDLQALAYAAAYASASTEHLARTLRGTLARTTSAPVAREAAEAQIVNWVLGIESFAEWEPTREVRIKLVAPSFPKRVLSTVKWLGEVYAMPIEAIQVHLYDVGDGITKHLAFERLLPIPSTEQFGMTIREARQRPVARSGLSRRPDVLRTLLDAGELEDGASLWFLKRSHEFPGSLRAVTPDDHAFFEVVLDASGAKLRFQWKDESGELRAMSPSSAWRSIIGAIAPDHPLPSQPYRSVHRRYSTTPGGRTLGDLATERGLWPSDLGDDEDALA